MGGYRKLDKCRLGGSSHLVTVLSLGEQCLTGVFPSARDEKITKGPLDLVWVLAMNFDPPWFWFLDLPPALFFLSLI
jgi:hypothetical protein